MVANAKGTEVFVSANLNQGSVSVLAYNGAKKTLTQKQRLLPTNPDVNGYGFRMALDPSGKVLAVAGKTSLDDPVVVDIYKKRGHAWTRTQTLSVPKYPQRNWGTALTMSQVHMIYRKDQLSQSKSARVHSKHPTYSAGREDPNRGTGRLGRLLRVPSWARRPVHPNPGAREAHPHRSSRRDFLCQLRVFEQERAVPGRGRWYRGAWDSVPWREGAIDPHPLCLLRSPMSYRPSSPAPAQQVWMYKWDKAQGIYVTMSNSALVPGSTGAVVLSPSGKDVAACYPAANNFNGRFSSRLA